MDLNAVNPVNPFQMNVNPFSMMPIQPQIQLPQTCIKYVNGKQGVENHQMAANSSEVFIDEDAKKFYTKKTDATGNATIKCFDYTESEEDKPVEYVTKAEFESFKAKMKGAGKKNEQSNGNVGKQQDSDASIGGNDAG